MDHAVFLRCGNSQILVPQSFTRSNIISARKLTNPHDYSIFFRSKNKTPTSTSTALISSSLSNCFSTTFTVGHPQRISARRLNSSTTPTLAHHGRISSTLSSSSNNVNYHQDYEGDKSKMAKTISSSGAGAGASLALSFVLGILCCGSMIAFMCPNKAIAGLYIPYFGGSGASGGSTTVTEQGEMISPITGTSCLKGFLQGILYLTSTDGTIPDSPVFYSVDAHRLKKQALERMKAGKYKEALDLLENERNKSTLGPQEKYYLDMALVEIKIYQGKYDEALSMGCLKDSSSSAIPSDIRRTFYKAIIYTMKDKKEPTARDHWLSFFERGINDSAGFNPY